MRRWRQSQNKTVKELAITDLTGYAKFIDDNKHILDYDIKYRTETIQRQLTYEILKVGDREHMILYDKDFVDTVRDTTKWLMDATFSILPKLKRVSQFLTIMGIKYGKVSLKKSILIKWVLMSIKNVSLKIK